MTVRRDLVFLSYAHQDEKWALRFKKMAAPTIGRGDFPIWTDHDINAGQDWRKEIDSALKSARAGLLLVSQSFLTSEFITTIELPALLDAYEKRELKIYWVLLEKCKWRSTELEKINAAHRKPCLKSISGESKKRKKQKRNSAVKKICIEVERILNSSPTKLPATAQFLIDESAQLWGFAESLARANLNSRRREFEWRIASVILKWRKHQDDLRLAEELRQIVRDLEQSNLQLSVAEQNTQSDIRGSVGRCRELIEKLVTPRPELEEVIRQDICNATQTQHTIVDCELTGSTGGNLEDLVGQAIEQIGQLRTETVLHATNSRAILAFVRTDDAIRFIRAVHSLATEQSHADCNLSSGMATGNFSKLYTSAWDGDPQPTVVTAGALRMAAKAGEVVLNDETWTQMPADFRNRLSEVEQTAISNARRWKL